MKYKRYLINAEVEAFTFDELKKKLWGKPIALCDIPKEWRDKLLRHATEREFVKWRGPEQEGEENQ